jgi:two-component system, LytTR family, response regulator
VSARERVTAGIVEDEPLMRTLLRDYAGDVAWLDVVGEAADGPAALRLIDEARPDMVFLDVHLPELSGIEVLERATHDPIVVFTTAHDQYAVAAFEVEALDYLLKPFTRGRFISAVDRARSRLPLRRDLPPARERARAALEGAPLTRLFVQERDRIVPVRTRDVTRFEAAGDYVRIHAGSGSHLARLALGELEARLAPDRFLRVHRSHIVNLDRIAALEHHDDRRLLVRMDDGTEVVASRSGTRELRTLIT